jgi:hypothetical protein
MKESDLYASIKTFIRDTCKYPCVTTEAGRQGIGYVDVFGARYRNPETFEIETVGVEVKFWKRASSADFGQAKGYSVFCDKVYFASTKWLENVEVFNDVDIKIAKYLGIGLIKIEDENPSTVLEAPSGKPIIEIRDDVLRAKDIFRCVSCNILTIYQKKVTTWDSNTKITSWTKDRIKEGKGLLIKNENKFYCNRCAKKKLKIGENRTLT